MTKSAKQIIKDFFKGAKLTNTVVVKVGKINKDIAFEISRVSNGMYMGKCYVTIVSSAKDLTLELLKNSSFDNFDLANKQVQLLKNK